MAYDFTGVNTKYLSGASPLSAGPFSISCWGRQDVSVSTKNTLAFLGVSSTDDNYYSLYTDNTNPPKVGVIMRAGSFSGNLTVLEAPLGQWNHYGVGIPSSPATGKVWCNGVSAALSNGVSPAGIDVLGVGCVVGNTKQQPWDGGGAEVAVWNVVLTDEEWALLAKRISPPMIRPGNLVHYRSLIRTLNHPFAPGGTLVNTGSVGVRAHPPMVYGSSRRRVWTVPATVPEAPTISLSAYSPEVLLATVTTVNDGYSPITFAHIEYRETLVGGSWTANSMAGSPFVFLVSGLTPNTAYDVRAKQENAIGEGPYSAISVITMPEPADQEALAIMGWDEWEPTPPLHAGGTWTQEDIQQVLGLPTDPLVFRELSRIVSVPTDLTHSLVRAASASIESLVTRIADVQPPCEWTLQLSPQGAMRIESIAQTLSGYVVPLEWFLPLVASRALQHEWSVEISKAQPVPLEWIAETSKAMTMHSEAWGMVQVSSLVGFENRGSIGSLTTLRSLQYEWVLGVSRESGLIPHWHGITVRLQSSPLLESGRGILRSHVLPIEWAVSVGNAKSAISEYLQSPMASPVLPHEVLGLVRSPREAMDEVRRWVAAPHAVTGEWAIAHQSGRVLPVEALRVASAGGFVLYEGWGEHGRFFVIPFEVLKQI